MMSSSVTVTMVSSEVERQVLRVSSSCFLAFFSSSRSAAAVSKFCSAMAASLARLISSMRASS
jgi:hypothetical protein